MSNMTSAEETHRLRLLRGDNYQAGYQPQWVRLTADTVRSFDSASATQTEEKRADTFVTRERSESIKSDDSSSSAELAAFKGVRLL